MASFNFMEPYLRSVFGFLGVTDATFLTAGGTSALNQRHDRNAFLAPHLQSVHTHAQILLERTPMKITSIVARYLLGLTFTVFGLNGFLNFIHQPPPANPLAMQFLVSVSESHFAAFFFAMQLLGGLLLLSGYFVPLALTVLAAELYNILAFHLTLVPASIALALVASVLWVLVFLQYRESFKGIFRAKPATQA
jgi:putative oxidoreductase